MSKTFKKSDINKYIIKKNIVESKEEEQIDEFIDIDGTMINRNNNYKTGHQYIRSKKTTDDRVRNSTQGPEAYFIYGGPYYGVNYSYVVNEEEDLLEGEDEMYDELNVVPSKYSRDVEDRKRREAKMMADKDISKHYYKAADPIYDDLPTEEWRGYKLPYDTEFDFDFGVYSENEKKMRQLVDEIMLRKKTEDKGSLTKRTNEEEILGDVDMIPDVSELKDVHQKPIIIRKINSLLDLIQKEDIMGIELSILLNHIISNVDIESIDDKHREIIGDKIKYGGQGEK